MKEDLALFNDLNNQKIDEYHLNIKTLFEAGYMKEQTERQTEDEKIKEMIQGQELYLNDKIDAAIELLSQMNKNLESSLLNQIETQK